MVSQQWTRVPLLITQEKTCFCKLPASFESARSSLGATIFEVQWDSLENEPQTAYVGWTGAVSAAGSGAIEIPVSMARCIGLDTVLEELPDLSLRVRPMSYVPPAERIFVESDTADDWDLLQLHVPPTIL